MVEHDTFNVGVAGPIPASPTIHPLAGIHGGIYGILFAMKNRPLPRQPLKCLAAFVVFACGASFAEPFALSPLDMTGGREERPLSFDSGHAIGKSGCTRSGNEILCENPADDPKVQNGWRWHITLKQTNATPFAVSAESLAEAPAAGAGYNYSIYLDIAFMDGSRLYGQASEFACDPKRGWQRKTVNVVPDKPVLAVSAYLLYRYCPGRVRFRAPAFISYPSKSASMFDSVCVDAASACLPKVPGYIIRDVASGSGFALAPAGRTTLGVSVQDTTETRADSVVFHDVTLKETTGRDRAVTLVYTIPIDGNGPITWWSDPRISETLGPKSGQRRSTSGYRAGCGALARWPFGAVSAPEGKAVGYDPDAPVFFRTGVHASLRVLYIAFDVGFAPEHPAAHFRFLTFPFRAQDGFRGALAAYQSIFPEHHRVRLHDHGLWMAFRKISSVEGWEDFGFRIKEGDNEPGWDDAHGITTFHYTEPTSWWMTMKGKTGTYSFEDCLAEANRQADAGVPVAKAWRVSTYHDEDGGITGSVRDTPWCRGAVWNLCSLPDLPGGEYAFKLRNPAWEKRYAGRVPPAGVDGEYIDSAEPHMTPSLDFNRAHFAAARTPLVFSVDTHVLGVAKCLSVYEYVRETANRVHAMNRYLMGNGIPYSWPWLVPFSDYGGQETKWIARGEGAWTPMSDHDLIYRRAMSGGKPYCFLMNVNFDKFSDDLVDKYMQRALAYGIFASFFSPNASGGHYFSRPDLYNRHRPLFKKYVPVCKLISEAGWRPVNKLAKSETPGLFVEQFGDRYLTVFNSGTKPLTARLRLNGEAPALARELLTDETWEFKDGAYSVDLPPETVRVLEFRPVPRSGEES